MRILIRTSRWAIWSRRFGSFALPVLVIPVFLHRVSAIDSRTFLIILAVAMGFAALALLTGLIAFVRLWYSGDRGWDRAATGALIGILCLSPLAYAAVQAQRYPWTNEVSTDWQDPPEMPISGPPEVAPEMRARIAEVFPNAVNRTYQLEPARIYALAEELMVEQDWDIQSRSEPGSGQSGQLHAVATTWLGWPEEVAVEITPIAEGGTRVAMRSRSLSRSHDLGGNGQRVGAFLVELDERVSGWIRDNPEPEEQPEE